LLRRERFAYRRISGELVLPRATIAKMARSRDLQGSVLIRHSGAGDLQGSVLIRHSGAGDHPALERLAAERLAALDGRQVPTGTFLLAEVDGELVAAKPLDADAETLSDPFRSTANVRALLELRARHVRQDRSAVRRQVRTTPRALPDTA
jgi:hypothetical protein